MTLTDAPAVTPTLRRALRRGRVWIAIVAAVLVLALISLLAAGGSSLGGAPLAADNAAPDGGRALAEVLRAQGVQVTATGTLDETDAAAGPDPAGTTILLYDASWFLDRERIDRLGELADRIVVLSPTADVFDAYAPDVAFAGFPDADAALRADCDVPAAVRADAVTAGESSFSSVGDAGDTEFCFPDDGGGYQLAQAPHGPGTVTLLADAAPFDNEHIIEAGNAALALNLLGETDQLVWYLPSFLDLDSAGEQPTLADLTPEWVTPVLVLLIALFVAAAVWRGRRLGPLVVEDLPVVVRARETMEGRARLYQRSSARGRALDNLRVGTIRRLSGLLGLARAATVEDVVRAAASALGRPADDLRRLLLDDDPANDAALLDLSDALLRLERDVRAATDPTRPGSEGRP
ncbi:MAG: Secreted protein [Naasia sp.]|nr:Secreted protein [Naasia sp.]